MRPRSPTEEPVAEICTLEARPRTADGLPASFAQRRFWLLEQLVPEPGVYNVLDVVRLRGPLDAGALAVALERLAVRHESLHTTFAEVIGVLRQRFAGPMKPALPCIDVGGRQDEAAQLVREEARRPFDLAAGPLWRAKLLRLATEEHLLLITAHHTVVDDESWSILLRDLAAFYTAAVSGRPADLPELAVQYADCGAWQQARLDGPRLRELLAYWKKKLGGSLSVIALPTDRPRPERQTFRGALFPFDFAADVLSSARQLARAEQAVPAVVLLAAFAALLHRYTGQEDLLIGALADNRHHPEAEHVVGPFVNTVVIRIDISGDPTFRELVRRVRGNSLEAHDHREMPFERLVEELRTERGVGLPLLQVLFTYQAGASPFTAGGLGWEPELADPGTAKFDLTLTVEESAQGLRGILEYNTDLFNRATAERLAGHLRVLVEGYLAAPDTAITRPPLVTAAERQRLLVEWNDTRVDYRRDCCVHQLIAERAVTHPDRTAVLFGDESLTYGELNARANQFARHLRDLGVGPEILVGLCLERSAAMVVALLAILKAGGAYVPLDPTYPQDRLGFYARDSDISVLVTQQSLAGRVPDHGARVVFLDGDRERIARHPMDDLPPTATANIPVYVIYTSGSTGKPKGVEVLHGALSNLLNAVRKRPGLGEEDLLLAITTLSFDIHAVEVWLPLIVGARLLIADKETAADGVRLLQELNRSKATVLQATPATWRLLLAAGWRGTRHLKALCTGEALPPGLAAALLPRVAELWNLYGPTETTVWSTCCRVTSAAPPISIGEPLDNTQVFIVDAHLNPVPHGLPGELLIGGDGLARGYRNRPDLTAEKFIRSPFTDTPGARLYRTGDLARYLPDGNLECLGRIDHQVKVRGYRIELGEIEAALARHPDVRQSVVVARKDSTGADHLAAYVLLHSGKTLRPENLRAFLAAGLPDYMVPNWFVPLSAFPLTPNGKIDRKALPAPDVTVAAARQIVEPRNDTERELRRLWEEILRISPVGVTDNFFDLGGDSFRTALLAARVREHLGHAIPLGVVFTAPTVEKLAAILRKDQERARGRCLVTFHESGEKPPLFLIAGIGGHAIMFHKFVRLLGPDQPSFGLEAVGIDGSVKPPDRIEDTVAYYLREIRAVRPHGPYLLGGYSIGALVAYELAVQMQADGETVSLLVLFDEVAPGYPRPLPWPRRLLIHIRNFFRLGSREKGAYLRERFLNVKRRLFRGLGLGVHNAPRIRDIDPLAQESLRHVWAALWEAGDRYRPARRYVGRTALFKASDGFNWPATVFDDPLLGWGHWCNGPLEVETVPGGHLEVFDESNVGPLAEKLRATIAQAIGTFSGPVS
jgi:amino acid adenylation domain-containing protein